MKLVYACLCAGKDRVCAWKDRGSSLHLCGGPVELV